MTANGRGRPRKDMKGLRRKRSFGKSKTGGMPCKFNDAMIPIAKKLAAQGYTDMEVADVFDVSYSTLQKWKLKVPEFGRAMKRGEDLNVLATERAMFQVSQGYAHRAEKILVCAGQIKRVKTEERFPPNVAAAKLLLAAKKPDQYGDKLELANNQARPIEFRLMGLYDKDNPPPKE